MRKPWIFTAMILMITFIVLAGCEVHPLTKTVRTNQDYTMPDAFMILHIKVNQEDLPKLCGHNLYGCIKEIGENQYLIYFTSEYVYMHEHKHQAYGPEHN